jgi:hypothetical protein
MKNGKKTIEHTQKKREKYVLFSIKKKKEKNRMKNMYDAWNVEVPSFALL